MYNGILYFRKKYLSLDKIRKLVKKCSSFQGFLFFNSVGTGSGFFSLLIEKLCLEYFKKKGLDFNFCISNISNIIVEPYNVILSHNALIEYLDVSVILNNEAIYDICRSQLDINTPNYNNLNRLIS